MTLDESMRESWSDMQRKSRGESADSSLLKGDVVGGTSGPMEPSVSLKDYVDKADEAVESRLMSKLDTLATKDALRSNIWGAVAALAALILGLAAFGGDRFDAGLGIADQRQEQLKRDEQQDRAVAQMNGKLDVLIASQGKAQPQK